MKLLTPVLLCLATLTGGSQACALTCQQVDHLGNSYTVCEVDAATDDLRLFLRDDMGEILGQFSDVAQSLTNRNYLAFAMNAGMYHPNRAPVGLYVENSIEFSKLLTKPSKGNFGMLPNGVFCIRSKRIDVFETLTYVGRKPNCRYASQSGPMLVINGNLHHRFLPKSTSRYIRNGVGTSENGSRAAFAISNNKVTFYEFALLFKEVLATPNALYFDGKVSRLHAPSLNRSDAGFWMGPIVGVIDQDGL